MVILSCRGFISGTVGHFQSGKIFKPWHAKPTLEWLPLLQTQLQTDTAATRDSQGTLHHHVTAVLHSTHQIPGPQCLSAASPEGNRKWISSVPGLCFSFCITHYHCWWCALYTHYFTWPWHSPLSSGRTTVETSGILFAMQKWLRESTAKCRV